MIWFSNSDICICMYGPMVRDGYYFQGLAWLDASKRAKEMKQLRIKSEEFSKVAVSLHVLLFCSMGREFNAWGHERRKAHGRCSARLGRCWLHLDSECDEDSQRSLAEIDPCLTSESQFVFAFPSRPCGKEWYRGRFLHVLVRGLQDLSGWQGFEPSWATMNIDSA